jgi:trans-aconitate methyltransferase
MTRRQAEHIVHELAPTNPVPVWNVLDVGCGIGRLVDPIHSLWPDWWIWGVDQSPAMIAEARERCVTPRSHFLEPQDGGVLSNAAYCVLVLQHLDDAKVADLLAWIADHLPTGGRLVSQWVVGNPNQQSGRSFPRYWDRVGWLLADAGFTTVREVWDWGVTCYADEWLWVTSEKTG